MWQGWETSETHTFLVQIQINVAILKKQFGRFL